MPDPLTTHVMTTLSTYSALAAGSLARIVLSAPETAVCFFLPHQAGIFVAAHQLFPFRCQIALEPGQVPTGTDACTDDEQSASKVVKHAVYALFNDRLRLIASSCLRREVVGTAAESRTWNSRGRKKMARYAAYKRKHEQSKCFKRHTIMFCWC